MKSLRLFFFVGLIGLTVECPGSQFTRAPVAVPTFAATARGQTVTLTWAQASETLDMQLSHTLLSWEPAELPPMGSIEQPLHIDKGTLTTTIPRLMPATVYNFTAQGVDITGNQSAPSTSVSVTTGLRPVAMFTVGQEDGDFGLGSSGRCQTRLEDNSYAIGRTLRNLGYTKAVFFGGTPSYNFVDLATDADALGMNGQTDTALEDRELSVFALEPSITPATVTETTTFAPTSLGEDTRTVGSLVNVSPNGAWQDGIAEIITGVIGTGTSSRFWSFVSTSGGYAATLSCADATSTAGNAIYGNSSSVNGDPGIFTLSTACTTAAAYVFCLAH